jgi:anti-sigma regulatory factor (Ser/Thr protein kinase)
MLDLFINAVRFAVSEDVRKSTTAILEMLKKSPEWQQDICTLEASIDRSFAEQSALLSDLTLTKMENLSYSRVNAEQFRFIFTELVKNAFEHGCKFSFQNIKITVHITKPYVALTVLNPRGSNFDLEETVKHKRQALSLNPGLRRGRGLVHVNDIADTFESVDGKRGVKAVIYLDQVGFEVKASSYVTIIKTTSGLFNPSLGRRLITIATEYLNTNLILDFSNWWSLNTEVDAVILELKYLYEKAGKNIIALLHRGGSLVTLPDAVVAYSLEEVARKISGGEYQATLELLIEVQSEKPLLY